jgi:hypothetical protein
LWPRAASAATTVDLPVPDIPVMSTRFIAVNAKEAAQSHRSQWTIVSSGWRAAGLKSVPMV